MIMTLCPNCNASNQQNKNSCTKCEYKLKLKNKYYLKKILNKDDVITYLGVNNNKKNFVIKEFSLRDSNVWDDHSSFQKEADILSQLNHSSIPKFIESFELGNGDDLKSYLVMEYIDGISLKEEQRKKRYTEKEIIKDIIQIAHILEYLHNLLPPVIHQDLNLSNIVRRKSGALALIDFNSVQDIILKERKLDISGTYGYISPEQLEGKPVVASDYYSLGIAILLLLSKKELDEMIDNNGKLNWKNYVNASDHIIKLIEGLLLENPKKRVSSLKEVKDILYGKKEKTYKKSKNIVKPKRKIGAFIILPILLSVVFPIALNYYINEQNANKVKPSKITNKNKIKLKVVSKFSSSSSSSSSSSVSIVSKVKGKRSDKAYDKAVKYLSKKDFIRVISNFMASCNKNKNKESCYQLAELYKNGTGKVKKDNNNAIKYYSKACKLGNQKACNMNTAILELIMGKEYQKKKNYKSANTKFMSSCKKGLIESCEFIGWNYEKGFGYKKDITKAKRYYGISCEKDSAYSCNKMGYFYETGQNLKKDLVKSRTFYEKSCNLGFGLGCSNLAKFYLKGLGGKKSKRNAIIHYRKACKLGYKKACK